MKIKTLLLFVFTLLVSIVSSAAVSIKEIGGWFESGYVKLDTELVRDYGTYGRADVLGVVPGSYIFKVVPVDEDGTEMDMAAESTSFAVKAHDRAGFAHFNYSGVGAYKDDGTLKENAKVLYVTSKTAKTVICDVVTDSKGKVETFTGLQAIIDARQKGYDTTPLVVRIVGTIEAADMDYFSSSAEGLQIKGKNADSVRVLKLGIWLSCFAWMTVCLWIQTIVIVGYIILTFSMERQGVLLTRQKVMVLWTVRPIRNI